MANMTLKGKVGAGAAGGALLMAVAFIGPWEGRENDPYLDIVKVKSVCYGETLNVEDRHYSNAECDAMLLKAVEIRYMKPVMGCTPQIKGNEQVLAAATSLSYNIGVKAYCGSTVAKRFRVLQYRAGCDAFMSWVYAGGKRVQGLVNRRKAERDLCLKGLS